MRKKEERVREEEEPAREIITSPTDLDVLNGRRQIMQHHPGNVNCRKLVHVNKVRKWVCQHALNNIDVLNPHDILFLQPL